MKNFTNNFKQFTSRLSARWLIMALMMLVGTSSAWAADKVIYITTGTSTGYSNPYIYVWNNSSNNGWPGKAMESAEKTSEGYPVYKYTWTSEFSSFIVMDGNCGDGCKKTGDVSYSKTQSYIYNVKTGNWSSYTPTQSATFSFSLPELYVGTPATITYSLSPSNAGSVSFSCTTSNATISGNQITANSSGTVTVKATIKYNSGYSGTTTTSKSTTAYIPAATKLYLKPTGWTGDNAKFSAYFFTGTSTNQWKAATVVCNATDVYEVELPSGKWTNLIWCRMNPSGSQEAWSGSWGQTVDLIYEGKNLYTINNAYGCGDNKSCGVWDTYTPPSCCTEVNVPNVTSDGPICAGSTATLTLTNRQDGVTYTVDDVTAFSGSTNTYTSSALNTDKTFTIVASHEDACTNNVEGSVTVTVNQPPTKKPTLSSDKTTLVAGENATLTVSNTESGITYTLYKDGASTGKTGTSFTNITAGKYKVVATDANSCGSMDSDEITISDCPAMPTLSLSIEQEIVDNCGSVTNGIIAISNYANFSGCTFTLNGDVVTPTKEGKIIDVTASGTCTVVATNSCGNKNTAEITMTKTTVKAPRTDFEVSLSYPQVGFAQNTGSVNIDLSGSERNVTYYLYKNGQKVDGSDQLGEGRALRWTVSSTGSYTVKADNPCNGEIAMTGQVDFTCMSNLELAFEGGKSTFCPGETANIIVTFNGTGKGDENTNPGKYGWQWTTDNITYTSVYLTESDVKVPVTIKGDGSISLSVRSCNGTVNSNELTFTTHKIVAPDIKFTPNPVKEGTVTVLSIEHYDANNTYEFNGPDDLQGTMTQTQEFQLSAGSYAFTVTATSKACPSVTATSETETLTVQEGGVAIDILGDEAIYSNDPTDFVAMYVTEKNGMADFPDAEGIAISSYTWEYSANGTSNWAACKEYDNATLGVKNNGSKCNNLRPNKVGYYRCVISYIDGAKNYIGSLTSNVLQVTQAGTNPNTDSGKNQHIKREGGDWTLPIISVNTGDEDFPTCSGGSYPSAQTDKLKKKRSVDVKIFNPDGTVYYDRKARMNYRGSSSLNFKKKSYAFCPGKENCGDDEKGVDYVKTSKENLFGLSNGAKDKDWVLYAAAADPSLMRNRVVFNTFKEMTGKWGVDTKYVELVVNGVYQGVYVLMDKITANEKRVNITDKNGFIVKFDKTDIEDREKSLLEGGMEVGDEKTFMTTRTGRLGIVTYGTKVDQLFEIEYPEKEDIEDEGGSWAATLNFIKQKFEQFETALANSDYATVRNLIDYQSWADWFIINEYTKNLDAYRASCVFVYNGDKIEVMPLWDQELSFNNQAGADIWKKGCDNTNGLLIQHEGVYTDCFPAPFWFIGKTVNFGSCGGNNGNSTITGTIGGYLINDACFVNTIKQRWTYHMQNSLSSTELKKKVDAYTSELTTAIKRESKRWSDDFRCNAECGGGTGYNSQSYENSLKTLNEWITGNRTTNLTAAISNLNGASSAGITITMEPTTGITTPWVPVKVLVNAPTSATIKYDDTSITEGITEKKDKAIKTVNDNLYTYIFPRPTSWGTGNVATPIEQKTYEIRAIMTNASDDCPGVSNEAVATIKLADEGNDNCVENK